MKTAPEPLDQIRAHLDAGGLGLSQAQGRYLLARLDCLAERLRHPRQAEAPLPAVPDCDPRLGRTLSSFTNAEIDALPVGTEFQNDEPVRSRVVTTGGGLRWVSLQGVREVAIPTGVFRTKHASWGPNWTLARLGNLGRSLASFSDEELNALPVGTAFHHDARPSWCAVTTGAGLEWATGPRGPHETPRSFRSLYGDTWTLTRLGPAPAAPAPVGAGSSSATSGTGGGPPEVPSLVTGIGGGGAGRRALDPIVTIGTTWGEMNIVQRAALPIRSELDNGEVVLTRVGWVLASDVARPPPDRVLVVPPNTIIPSRVLTYLGSFG